MTESALWSSTWRDTGSEGCIFGDRISILGVVRIPHKAVAVPPD